MTRRIPWWPGLIALAVLAAGAGVAQAQPVPQDLLKKSDPDMEDWVRAVFPEYFQTDDKGQVSPLAAPDYIGHGNVLDVGKLVMKVTNYGVFGNPYTNVSSDPSCQWPGTSGIEYMNFVGVAVGAVNPNATDPNAIRRVSYINEWRPPTLDPEDKIYPAYAGIVNGTRFSNDDGDRDPVYNEPMVDEDFLDGHDNDGDGLVDEDYAALGQKMYSWVTRDDTPEAVNFAQTEKHVPLGMQINNKAWSYSLAEFENFDVVEYEIVNVSGHDLDSVVVGFRVDMDCGPFQQPNYFNDDFDLPRYPQGAFKLTLGQNDARRQTIHDPALYSEYPAGTALCPQLDIRINGFALSDDNGDESKTAGVPSFLLFEHTVDPLGLNGPPFVGFRAFRSFPGGTPYTQNGNPTIDQQRFEFMSSTQNIEQDPGSPYYGFITAEPGEQKGDYSAWASMGVWPKLPNGGKIQVSVGMNVSRGTYLAVSQYVSNYERYLSGQLSQEGLFQLYPTLASAYAAQVAYEGIWEVNENYPNLPDYHGRETGIRLPRGSPVAFASDCRDQAAGGGVRPINDLAYTWFDFDCDYCSGVYNWSTKKGLFHKTWNASAPPPNPNLNTQVSYNYAANPDRQYAPAGDGSVMLAWDNLSEVTPDPGKNREFDFRGYKVWKAANWTRPVGSSGPSEEEWSLMATYRQFNYRNINGQIIPRNYWWDKPAGSTDSIKVCPKIWAVWTPDPNDSAQICLDYGDLWNEQTGDVLHPDTSVPCAGSPGPCAYETGCRLGVRPCQPDTMIKYPIGRYRFVDQEVKNGFMYFYAVTAFDSTNENNVKTELEGRRSAVEAEGVVPQISPRSGKGVWVVPNPYKGGEIPQQRPSSWDLTPNGTDPTGTHIDFFGMPQGQWTIRIYTISGDLVATLNSTDGVNEAVRSPITTPSGALLPGYNNQQDTPNDGQARWNLISRNGQDVVSGVYLFTVESQEGTQRGKFVIIR